MNTVVLNTRTMLGEIMIARPLSFTSVIESAAKPPLVHIVKRICLSFLTVLLAVSQLVGCAQDDGRSSRLIVIKMESAILGKEMISQVYLPENYDAGTKYPVLYFLPSNGGSSYTVIDKFDITGSVDRLTRSGEIKPMIVVALGIDNSFGLNSAQETHEFTTSSEKTFDAGLYEDYIMREAIPYVDAHYSTDASREGRYIGGYSMGGFAALYIAFRYPESFSRAGGHSPSLFVGDFPDTTVSDWLYPDSDTRAQRDPILIAREKDLSSLSVYLDTDAGGVNVEGCRALYDILTQKRVNAQFHLFPGTHSLAYCQSYMD